MPQQVPPPPVVPSGDLSSQLEHTPPTRLNLNNCNNTNQEATRPSQMVEPELETTLEAKTIEATLPTQALDQQQVNNHNQALTTNGTANKKLNGLKNRIIQRPPPLILDKVSNFYDTTTATNETINNNQIENNNEKTNHINVPESNNNINTQPLQATTTNANQKFWASLNQNAAALRYRQTNSNSITTSQSNDINDVTKSSINSPNNLGADLVITQRNSTQLTTNRNNHNNPIVQKSQSSKIDNLVTNVDTNSIPKQNFDDYNVRLKPPHESNNTRPLDMSNNSENEELTRLANENGGNLIGVDNSSPPASEAARNNNNNNNNNNNMEPPNSATRPRSNNPFLVMDDEEQQSTTDHLNVFDNQSNFQKRPASFIAATDVASFINQQREKQQLQQQSNPIEHNISHATSTSNGDPSISSRHLANQFKNLRIDSGTYLQHMYNPQQADTNPISDQRDAILLDEHEKQQFDEAMGAIYGKSTNKQLSVAPRQNDRENQSIYGIYGHNDNLVKYDSSISRDSESPLPCKPPLEDSMQLPMWTDAIYYLNNAIIDTSSVAGGAENGQFIYIVENGDIILELDNVKVSGLTLVEFNELLESKPVHLLSAVQTKHSQGLTIDLKRYLNSTFPNNSEDKKLQNLIRENVYRRTIPCTTRPPRDGEVDKVDYHFLTKEQFVEMNNKGMLLECGMYGGNYYGTMKPYSDINNSTIYGSLRRREVNQDMQQQLNPNHPIINKAETQNIQPIENPLYENHESLRMYQLQNNHSSAISFQQPHMISSDSNVPYPLNQRPLPPLNDGNPTTLNKSNSMLGGDFEPLPHGWEKIIDETHGTYYVDHNTQRTQYEKPYEIELTKGASGFGFTLVEAENGILLVRSIMRGGPAHLNGTIRPGDILISAVGVPVFGLQHTDIARLFSTFAVGDRVRLTFARSAYVVDDNFVPDEVLFSNGTNGDMSVAVNSDYFRHLNRNSVLSQDPQLQQEFDYISVTLKRGDQGFGFTINDSVAGQKVIKNENKEACTNLRQGDILININGQDITNLQHKQVVEILKNCPPGQDANLIVKRKKRFRSKTPMAMHTETGEFTIENPPQRNCKTPSLDGLMLRRSTINQRNQPFPSSWNAAQFNIGNDSIQNQITPQTAQLMAQPSLAVDVQGISIQENYSSLPVHMNQNINSQSIYGVNTNNDPYYTHHQPHQLNSLPMTSTNNSAPMIAHQERQELNLRPPSISESDRLGSGHMTNSVQLSEASLPPMKFANLNGLTQTNQYNNFMNNDKLVMMQMHQSQYQQTNQTLQAPSTSSYISDYNRMPLYSNTEIMRNEPSQLTCKPSLETYQTQESVYDSNLQNNYYANNEEIAQQRAQFNSTYSTQQPMTYVQQHLTLQQQPQPIYGSTVVTSSEGVGEYEYHQVVLDRDNTDSNWGIRLIGGSEADRAISIGSIVFGGAASKNGRLKSGDEIISINGINVVGATHRHVVELISACTNKATLIIRRNKFAEACEVILNRNMDEGFGFVIISNDNCVVIGKIKPGSPADRCQQLHVRDQIIGVNGRFIGPNMMHPDIVNMIKESGSTLRLTIIPADCYSVELIKNAQNDNFGFRMRGGSEYDGTPLYILRVAPNGLARDLLNVGDQIIAINGMPTVGMTHQQAATIIKYSDPIVKLKLRRNHVTPPSLLVDSPRALQMYNQVTAEMKTVTQNPTPILTQDPSLSTQGSYVGQNLPIMMDGGHSNQLQQQQHLGQTLDTHQDINTQDGSNAISYNPSMPLYAT